jgi:GNAT superfamily N-acetyltransferase
MRNSSMETRAGAAAVLTPASVPDSPVRTAALADAARCAEVLTLAFASDPPSRWIWPEEQQYFEAFPRFVEAFGGAAVDSGTAYYFEGFAGAALWMPPGAVPDWAPLTRVLEETISNDRRDAAFSLFEQMEHNHPSEPHWHLPLIGVDPAAQGRGIGSVLLRHVLDRCDRDGTPAYLEATSARNAALYARHGFDALGVIEAGALRRLSRCYANRDSETPGGAADEHYNK